jgi:hypothetical protein
VIEMFWQCVLCFKLKTKDYFLGGKIFCYIGQEVYYKEFVGRTFLNGSTAPRGPERPHCLGFTITDTLPSVGIL